MFISCTFNALEYGVCADGSDSVPGVRRAFQAMHGKEAMHRASGATLVFPKGRYHFWPDLACEQYVFPSNNDPGLKRIAFPLFNRADIEIDEGEVLAAAKDDATGLTHVDIRISSQFPFQVSSGRLQFQYEWPLERETVVIGNLLEFDPVRRETAFLASDNYGVPSSYSAEQPEDGVVRLTAKFSALPVPGNIGGNIGGIGGYDREYPGSSFQSARTA